MSKAKKQIVQLPLSIEETMTQRAEDIRTLRAEIEAKKLLLEAAETDVKEYMTKEDLKTFAGWQKVERIGSIKFDGASGKKLEQIEDALKGEVDARFLDVKINKTALYNALNYDHTIVKALAYYNVQLVQSPPSISLQKIK